MFAFILKNIRYSWNYSEAHTLSLAIATCATSSAGLHSWLRFGPVLAPWRWLRPLALNICQPSCSHRMIDVSHSRQSSARDSLEMDRYRNGGYRYSLHRACDWHIRWGQAPRSPEPRSPGSLQRMDEGGAGTLQEQRVGLCKRSIRINVPESTCAKCCSARDSGIDQYKYRGTLLPGRGRCDQCHKRAGGRFDHLNQVSKGGQSPLFSLDIRGEVNTVASY